MRKNYDTWYEPKTIEKHAKTNEKNGNGHEGNRGCPRSHYSL